MIISNKAAKKSKNAQRGQEWRSISKDYKNAGIDGLWF